MALRAWYVLAGISAASSTAFASIAWSTGQGEYSVSPGQRVTVPLFLDFTEADADFLLGQSGLFSAGVTVAVTDSQPNGTPAQILALTDIAPNVAAFSDPGGPTVVYNGPLSAGILVLADPFGNTGVIGQPLGVSGRRIEIGSITFTAGLNAGEITSVQVADFNTNTSDTVTWNDAVALDSVILPGAFAIRVVPAPGSVAVWAVASGLMVRRRPGVAAPAGAKPLVIRSMR